MAETITPVRTEMGWAHGDPQPKWPKFSRSRLGSFASPSFYPKEGGIETEILPPPSDELKEDFERLFNKYCRLETCEELKRIGDF